jgi:hypothetical protein
VFRCLKFSKTQRLNWRALAVVVVTLCLATRVPHAAPHAHTHRRTHLNYIMAPQRLPEPLLDENDNRYAMRCDVRAGRDSNVAFESMRWRGGTGEAMARLALERARGVKGIL